MSPLTLTLLTVVPVLLLQLALFLRWLHRRIRDDEIHRAFFRDLATNHLPPQIQYLELNGHRRRDS